MSTKSTIKPAGDAGLNNAKMFTWASLLNGEAGDPIGSDFVYHSDRSVQVTGTFGTGGSVVIEGSNDGVNYFPLTNPAGATGLAFTTAGLKQVLEACIYMRPRVTAGDGTTNVSVVALLRVPTTRVG